MILSDTSLLGMLPQLIPNDNERDESLVNPASIDIRFGSDMIIETGRDVFVKYQMSQDGYWLEPGELILVNTYERIAVPNGYSVSLYMKSSTARKGINHLLAFWVDPGWDGYLTMEIKNENRYTPRLIKPGMKVGQIVINKLNGLAAKPYDGRYQGAKSVEGAKNDVADKQQVQFVLSEAVLANN